MDAQAGFYSFVLSLKKNKDVAFLKKKKKKKKFSKLKMKRDKQTMRLLPSTVCVAELDISDALKSGEGQI